MHTFDPVWIKENIQTFGPILAFKVIKDVCHTISPPWKKNTSKKSSKAQNCYDIHFHDEWM